MIFKDRSEAIDRSGIPRAYVDAISQYANETNTYFFLRAMNPNSGKLLEAAIEGLLPYPVLGKSGDIAIHTNKTNGSLNGNIEDFADITAKRVREKDPTAKYQRSLSNLANIDLSFIVNNTTLSTPVDSLIKLVNKQNPSQQQIGLVTFAHKETGETYQYIALFSEDYKRVTHLRDNTLTRYQSFESSFNQNKNQYQYNINFNLKSIEDFLSNQHEPLINLVSQEEHPIDPNTMPQYLGLPFQVTLGHHEKKRHIITGDIDLLTICHQKPEGKINRFQEEQYFKAKNYGKIVNPDAIGGTGPYAEYQTLSDIKYMFQQNRWPAPIYHFASAWYHKDKSPTKDILMIGPQGEIHFLETPEDFRNTMMQLAQQDSHLIPYRSDWLDAEEFKQYPSVHVVQPEETTDLKPETKERKSLSRYKSSRALIPTPSQRRPTPTPEEQSESAEPEESSTPASAKPAAKKVKKRNRQLRTQTRARKTAKDITDQYLTPEVPHPKKGPGTFHP